MKKIICIFIVLTVLLTSVFLFTSCNKESIPSEFKLAEGTIPSSNPNLITSEIQTIIDAGMAEGATEAQKKDAVMALYNVANKSKIETPLSLTLQNSDAGIDAAFVTMRGFTLKNGDDFYYQMVTGVTAKDPDFEVIAAIMAPFAGMLKIGYSNPDGTINFVMVKGTDSEGDTSITTFPYGTYKLTEDFDVYTVDGYKQKGHFLNSIFEINNMDYCAEIIKDGSTIELKDNYYRVEFEIDCENGDTTLLQKWFNMANEDMKEGGQEISNYNSYKMILEVWDNGYIKYSYTNEDRSAGIASGKPINEFTYLFNEDEILEVLKQDQSIKAQYEDEIAFESAFASIDNFMAYYTVHEVEEATMSTVIIVAIVLGSIIGAGILSIIISAIVIETGLKKGKYPKIAAKRATKKEKKLNKKK